MAKFITINDLAQLGDAISCKSELLQLEEIERRYEGFTPDTSKLGFTIVYNEASEIPQDVYDKLTARPRVSGVWIEPGKLAQAFKIDPNE